MPGDRHEWKIKLMKSKHNATCDVNTTFPRIVFKMQFSVCLKSVLDKMFSQAFAR